MENNCQGQEDQFIILNTEIKIISKKTTNQDVYY